MEPDGSEDKTLPNTMLETTNTTSPTSTTVSTTSSVITTVAPQPKMTSYRRKRLARMQQQQQQLQVGNNQKNEVPESPLEQNILIISDGEDEREDVPVIHSPTPEELNSLAPVLVPQDTRKKVKLRSQSFNYPLSLKSVSDKVVTPRKPSSSNATNKLEDITSDRVYQLGAQVPFEEDREHEFKQLHRVDNPVKRIGEYAAKYINAFLNTNGGICYFGIDDRGIVQGVKLNRAARDNVRLHIDGVVEAIWPSVDSRTCAVVFVPVSPSSAAPDMHVVELHIDKGSAPVYLISRNKPTAYLRRAGSIYQMSMEMILQRMNFTMFSAANTWKPVNETVNYKLDSGPKELVPGRETDMDEIVQMLEKNMVNNDSSVNVVALSGPGGVGKTTLSRCLATRMAS